MVTSGTVPHLAKRASMDRYTTKMAALGRQFEVGDLYNNRNDSILLDQRQNRDSIDFKLDIKIVSKIKVESIGLDSSSICKWKHMGIDNHLGASIVAGLINFSGSSRYLTHRCTPNQVARTVIIQLESRKELLDLQTVHSHNIKALCAVEEKNQHLFGPATDLVLGAVYGREVYCVLIQDIANEEEHDIRQEADENLFKITLHMEIALKENLNLAAFQEQFDEKEIKRLAGVQCLLYANLQSGFVRECSVLDAYKHCLHLIQTTETQRNCEVIPIAVVLCPLKFILPSADAVRSFEYRDVDADVVEVCCQILDQLDGIITAAGAVRTTSRRIHRDSLRQFQETVGKYQKMLQNDLKNEILKAREALNGDDEQIKRIVRMAQMHPLFKVPHLEEWLRCKQTELDIVEKLTHLKGTTFFANRNQLETALANTFDQHFALVLRIPAVDDESSAILEAMRNYLAKDSMLTPDCSCASGADEEGNKSWSADGPSWHLIPSKRKQVFDKLREFANHIEKNKHLEDVVQFFVTLDHLDKNGCRYSVYQADNLLKDDLDVLPHPPTDLRADGLTIDDATAEFHSSTLRVVWNYPDVGSFPCHFFLVEFRPKGSCDKSWMQRKTTIPGENQTTISFATGLAMEIRVAAATCVGRSDFTDPIDTTSVTVVANKGHVDIVHRLSYESTQKDATVREEMWLKYPSQVNLFWPMSSRLEVQRDDRRIAERFAMENSRLLQWGHPSIHLLDLEEHPTSGDFRWMDVGRLDHVSKSHGRRDHKVIMLIGARDSGKSSLIDGMVNYILGVQWNDPFRFQCVRQDGSIDPKHLPTDTVVAYTVRHQDGMAIPYSITIIDAPGCVVDQEDEEAHEKDIRRIRRFLTQKNIWIEQVHAICLVADSNDVASMETMPRALDSVLSLFAEDVRNNVRLLVTMADATQRPSVGPCGVATSSVASAGLVCHTFDNSALYARNEDDVCFDQLFWQSGRDHLRRFFVALQKMNARHLEMTREVIQQRWLLDRCLEDIERGLEAYLVHVESSRMFARKIKEYAAKMEANRYVLVDQTEMHRLKVTCAKGLVAYNCRQCWRTCEGPVRSVSFASLRPMKKQCRHLSCPCPASEHDYQRFQWRPVAAKVTTTLQQQQQQMQADYESNGNDKLTSEQLLADCQRQLKRTRAQLFRLLARVGASCLVLEATALRPETLSLADYLSRIKNRVAEEAAPGYLTRLAILNELQQSVSC